MKNLFLFLALLLLGSSCDISGVLGNGDSPASVTPDRLLLDIMDDRRFVSVDQVADWIINGDPSVILVDVRSKDEFNHFSLPGALNIPLGNLLSQEAAAQLDCERRNLVFFSNGSVQAEQAWMLLRRKGCLNNYVMKGGLNEWGDKILQPQKPEETASSEAWELYNFRKAACKYFVGGSKALEAEPYVAPAKSTAPSAASKKEVNVQPKKLAPAAQEEEEGC